MDPSTAYLIFILIIAAGFGAITAKIASDRGVAGSPVYWFIAGAFLAIIALPLAIFLRPDSRSMERKQFASGEVKKCPQCAELVKRDALRCRFCGYEFTGSQLNETQST